jgi:hypothetical protein
MKPKQLTSPRVRFGALLFAAVGLLILLLGMWLDPQRAAPSYLIGYLFWLSISLGCYSVLMLHHLTGGKWGVGIRRFLEAGITPVPILALFFVPMALRARYLFPWAYLALTPNSVAQHRAIFSNGPAFAFRAILYFTIWIVLGWFLRRWSSEQDKTTDPEPTIRLRTLSGPGLLLHSLAVTFAAIDWVMVLERDWYSTVFPPLVLIGQVHCAISLAVIMLYVFRRLPGFEFFYTKERLNQYGNLLLTFVMLWTYLAFSQLLIIYAGNLPNEVIWYLRRIHGGWLGVGIFLALGQFFVPFLLLLFRGFKQAGRPLMLLACSQLVLQAIGWIWYIAPSSRDNLHLTWFDLCSFLGFGGAWVFLYLFGLARRPILAQNDPRFPLRFDAERTTLLS